MIVLRRDLILQTGVQVLSSKAGTRVLTIIIIFSLKQRRPVVPASFYCPVVYWRRSTGSFRPLSKWGRHQPTYQRLIQRFYSKPARPLVKYPVGAKRTKSNLRLWAWETERDSFITNVFVNLNRGIFSRKRMGEA